MFFPHRWPCQKHPSIKSATCSFGQAKSGFPIIGKCLRHPFIRAARSNPHILTSVVLFPTLRTLAISSDRFREPKDVFSPLAFPGQRVTVLSNGFRYLSSYELGKHRGDSVSYHVADGVHLVGGESVTLRERLQASRLSY